MTQFWLPGDSDFALAMREPNLLHNKKPAGPSIPLRPSTRALWLYNGTLNTVGPSLPMEWGQEHPTNHGGFVSDGVYVYADNGGSDDDVLKTIESIPSLRGGSGQEKQTLIIDLTPEWAGSKADFLTTHGWYLSFGVGDTKFGYFGGNGNNYYHTLPVIQWGKRIVVAISVDATNKHLSIYLDGAGTGSALSTTGNISYIGAGTLPLSELFGFSLGEFTNYYNLRGTIHSAALLYEYFDESALHNIGRNYYRELVTTADQSPFLISMPAGGGAPTLSSPGAINILSDRATPQVTLTF